MTAGCGGKQKGREGEREEHEMEEGEEEGEEGGKRRGGDKEKREKRKAGSCSIGYYSSFELYTSRNSNRGFIPQPCHSLVNYLRN